MDARPDVVIVGAGPAGTSTALHLVARDPAWAGRILLVDRAQFPREKLCGGGVTFFGARFLEQLGIAIEPCFEARHIRLRHDRRQFAFAGDPTVRVVRRDVFDAALVRACRTRGVTVHESTAVRSIARHPDAVEVETTRGALEAAIVVGADGAGSLVARSVRGPAVVSHARTLEVLTPADPATDPEFRDRALTVDFTPVSRWGLRGYVWHFPVFVDGRPHASRGVYECRLWPGRAKADLEAILSEALAARGIEAADWRRHSFPIPQWQPFSPVCAPRTLLVGDAAGADALTGEGISFALAHGAAAAEAVDAAFASGDFTFAEHPDRLATWPVLHQLATRRAVARWAYRIHNRVALDALWWLTARVVRDLDTARRIWHGLDRLRRLAPGPVQR